MIKVYEFFKKSQELYAIYCTYRVIQYVKKCTKCQEEKDLKNFNKHKQSKDGYGYHCQKCVNSWHKEHYIKNKKIINEKHKKHYERNKEAIGIKHRLWHKNNKEKETKQKQLYFSKPENREKRRIWSRIRDKERMATDINFKLKKYLRVRVWNALKGSVKSQRTMDLVGCDIEYLKQHLQSKFQPGMTWENYGKWHVDHIKPCSSFDLTIPENQKACFSHLNLQPLWAKDNLSKGGKIV